MNESSSVNIDLSLKEVNGEYIIILNEITLLKIKKTCEIENSINKIYDGIVKTFAMGVDIGQKSIIHGSTGFSLKSND